VALKSNAAAEIDFREIFGVVRFSTFATKSARSGHCQSVSMRARPQYAAAGTARERERCVEGSSLLVPEDHPDARSRMMLT
jgi:TolB-like protein